MVRVASLQTGNKKEGISERLLGGEKVNMGFICLRLVEDSDGLSRRGVQGVAAGVPRRELVITQEDDAGTGFRLKRGREDADLSQQISQRDPEQCILPLLLKGVWPDSEAPPTHLHGIFTLVSPRRDPGQLIGRVEDSAGGEGVG